MKIPDRVMDVFLVITFLLTAIGYLAGLPVIAAFPIAAIITILLIIIALIFVHLNQRHENRK